MSELAVTVDDVELTATWVDENTDTRSALADALPLGGDATRWGDELYFEVPVDVTPTETRETVPVGVVAQLDDIAPLSRIDGGAHVSVDRA